ncbi:MAG: hypothetical protein NUV55_00010 [Sulfuricaulis sp.]|uniref:hypothetical protein n=1 Tax=Sulfuricaulis sp. TaxID=2003553 RepID=UPI0025CE396F|nr:hypothetical protein [Sulfuricaulis sp.]MCR4345581.1 hypothetical protein [Sulfuricaulis sp.]
MDIEKPLGIAEGSYGPWGVRSTGIADEIEPRQYFGAAKKTSGVVCIDSWAKWQTTRDDGFKKYEERMSMPSEANARILNHDRDA